MRLIDADKLLIDLKNNSWTIDEWELPHEQVSAGLQANAMDIETVKKQPTVGDGVSKMTNIERKFRDEVFYYNQKVTILNDAGEVIEIQYADDDWAFGVRFDKTSDGIWMVDLGDFDSSRNLRPEDLSIIKDLCDELYVYYGGTNVKGTE